MENANFFMSRALKDFQGCKAGNRKIKGRIHAVEVSAIPIDEEDGDLMLEKQYQQAVLRIICKHRGKTVKILHRNNDLNCIDWSLEHFTRVLRDRLVEEKIYTDAEAKNMVSCSTVHRSKGLEADIVILLEMDARKFPEPPRENNPFVVFGESRAVVMADQHRLFYVALTRPKEEMYLLMKSCRVNKKDAKYNFLAYLNEDYLS